MLCCRTHCRCSNLLLFEIPHLLPAVDANSCCQYRRKHRNGRLQQPNSAIPKRYSPTPQPTDIIAITDTADTIPPKYPQQQTQPTGCHNLTTAFTDTTLSQPTSPPQPQSTTTADIAIADTTNPTPHANNNHNCRPPSAKPPPSPTPQLLTPKLPPACLQLPPPVSAAPFTPPQFFPTMLLPPTQLSPLYGRHRQQCTSYTGTCTFYHCRSHPSAQLPLLAVTNNTTLASTLTAFTCASTATVTAFVASLPPPPNRLPQTQAPVMEC